MGASEPRLTKLSLEIRSAEQTISMLRKGINRRRTELSALAQKAFILGGCSVRIQVVIGLHVEIYIDSKMVADRYIADRSGAIDLAKEVLRSSCHATDSVIMQDVVNRILNATGTPS